MHTPTSQKQLLGQRYGRAAQPEILWNDTVAHLIAHRSERSFLPTAVSGEEVATLVAAAQSASSSSNQHYWSVIAVRDAGTKAKLASFTQGPSMEGKGYDFVADAPLVLLWVADMSRNLQIAGLGSEEDRIVDYLDSLIMASVDTALAAQNAMVAAQAIGLGGVFLGSLRNRSQEIAELMNLPKHSYVVFGMALGRPDPEHKGSIRPRPPQQVVLHQEQYISTATDEWLSGYEQAFQDFRTHAGLCEKTWSDSVKTATSARYLDGREDLRETIESQGYSLK
ncbi:nitroreductase family protein [Glutamicibacter sp. NPDC087344]|uniref:nitroreductase family protein n=1 Tax=Glutamicibacter sp. NPDC087344 TaxID=3363994 RepID=UPI00380DFFC6